VSKCWTGFWETRNVRISLCGGSGPDLVVLDWMLPEKSGIDVCREIRQTSQCGIIMVTARSDESDKIVFVCMGLLVLILGGSHAVTNLVYMESLFDQFRNEEINAVFLNAPPEEQIEILKTYVTAKMEFFWLGK